MSMPDGTKLLIKLMATYFHTTRLQGFPRFKNFIKLQDGGMKLFRCSYMRLLWRLGLLKSTYQPAVNAAYFSVYSLLSSRLNLIIPKTDNWNPPLSRPVPTRYWPQKEFNRGRLSKKHRSILLNYLKTLSEGNEFYLIARPAPGSVGQPQRGLPVGVCPRLGFHWKTNPYYWFQTTQHPVRNVRFCVKL